MECVPTASIGMQLLTQIRAYEFSAKSRPIANAAVPALLYLYSGVWWASARGCCAVTRMLCDHLQDRPEG